MCGDGGVISGKVRRLSERRDGNRGKDPPNSPRKTATIRERRPPRQNDHTAWLGPQCRSRPAPPNFPANRDFCREFPQNSPCWRFCAQTMLGFQIVSGNFPKLKNREIPHKIREGGQKIRQPWPRKTGDCSSGMASLPRDSISSIRNRMNTVRCEIAGRLPRRAPSP